MSELDEASRALLALASDAHEPTAADRARVRAALAGRLGAAAGLGAGAAVGVSATAKALAGATVKTAAGAGGAASVGGAATAVTGAALATKVIVAVAVAVTVGAGATVELARRHARTPAVLARADLRGGRAAPQAPPRERAAREVPSVEAPLAAASPAHAGTPPTPPPEPGARSPEPALRDVAAPSPVGDTPRDVGPPPFAPRQILAPRVVTPAPAPPTALATTPRAAPVLSRGAPPPAPVASTRPTVSAESPCGAGSAIAGGGLLRRPAPGVADEARLVHDGARALREGQPACALALLDAHARFYPDGVLGEERDAERALALAALGRSGEARAAAAAFLRAHPTSPLGARLRRQLPGVDPAGGASTGKRPSP